MGDSDFVFDPDEHVDANGGGGSKYKGLKVAGTYLLGVRDCVKHDTTNNGKLFSRLAFVVIDGPHKDESFTDRVFRSPSSYKRLGYVCKAMRIGKGDGMNPSKNHDIERVMVGRALKASVEVNEKGYAELKWPETEWTEDELAIMKGWEAKFRKDRKAALDKATDFDDAPLDQFPADDFGDDDIPF